MMDTELSRPDCLAIVRKRLGKEFPAASFSTNDDANPATPFMVTAKWGNGKIIKIIRADSPSSTVDQFLGKVIPLLTRFQADNVPDRHLH